MANNGNLKPWVKGQSGNLKGRPKGARSREALFREFLEAKALKSVQDFQFSILDDELAYCTQNIADQITLTLIIKALSGNEKAIEMVFDNTFGKL